MSTISASTFQDPIAHKVSRTLSGYYIRFKQAAMNCVVHAIYDQRAKFLYVPVPKVACSSIKSSLLEHFDSAPMQNEAKGNIQYPHKYFRDQPRFWITVDTLREFDGYRFCVVRDPISRFVSGYRNRVLDNRDLQSRKLKSSNSKNLPEFPDINFFALHLREYCQVSEKINWHFRPQAAVVCDPSAYDRIYDISEIDTLYADVRERGGVDFVPHKRNKSRAPTPDQLNQQAQRALLDFYRIDFETFSGIMRPLD